MSPQKHKYHYLLERECIRQDPRLAGFWALGHDAVSSVQECMARLWPNDPIGQIRGKLNIEMPLHWFLTQKVEIIYDHWNQHPALWKLWARVATDDEAFGLAKLSEVALFMDLICEDGNSTKQFTDYMHWDLLLADSQDYQQLRTNLLNDMRQYGMLHPVRNILLFQIMARMMEPLMGMGYQGSWQGPVRVQYSNGWGRDAIDLRSTEQQALIRETARFLDCALPILCERFDLQTVLQLLLDERQGLLNFWLTRNTPQIAQSVRSDFQRYHDNPCLASVNAHMPLKRLPLLLLVAFGTESMWHSDAAHVCLGRSLRDLPTIQNGNDPNKRERLSPKAAHILGRMRPCGDFHRDIYRAVCLAVWLHERWADVVAHNYVEEGGGNFTDPFIKELMLFFKRNEQALEGVRLWNLIDYLKAEKLVRPDFRLRGRSVAALVRRMEAWHEELGQLRHMEELPTSWPSCGIKTYFEASDEQGLFTFSEICTQSELIEEGRTMRHCVASYIDGCIKGNYSIWSLKKASPADTQHLLTIQINRDKSIVQACGPHNRPPNKPEWQLLKNWAKIAGLRLDYERV